MVEIIVKKFSCFFLQNKIHGAVVSIYIRFT
jgi:hypothetical protein